MSEKSIVLYTYSKCSTCRDASRWLVAHGINLEERPIYERPPTSAELRRMLAFLDGHLRRLFNTSGIQYRAMGLAAKLPGLSEPEALALLAGDGRLVKRPFLLADSFGLVGFDEDAWSERLA